DVFDRTLRILVDDHVQAVSEKGNTPTIHFTLEKVVSPLWFVGDELQQASLLCRLEGCRRSLSNQFASNHEAQAITLFGLFEVVRCHENGHASIREGVNHFPEGPAGQRIDARSGLI